MAPGPTQRSCSGTGAEQATSGHMGAPTVGEGLPGRGTTAQGCAGAREPGPRPETSWRSCPQQRGRAEVRWWSLGRWRLQPNT